MNNIKVSVACCTYNGEKFILEQLQSMARQTRVPDELVVCDDGSSDSTINIIKSFAVISPFPVRLYENHDKPLRSTKNFEKAINLCSGEIIVLSDQDDIWEKNKVELLEKAIDDGAGLVFSDATLVDESLRPLGYSLFDSLHFSNKEKSEISREDFFRTLLRRNIVTGAATAFASKHINLIMPISENWVHDGWIALLIASVDKVTILRQCLFMYRQHNTNQIGAKRRNLREKIELVNSLGNKLYLESLQGFIDLKNRMMNASTSPNKMEIEKLLNKKIKHLENRSVVVSPAICNFFILLKELTCGKYHFYSRGWTSYSRDVVMLGLNLIHKYYRSKS